MPQLLVTFLYGREVICTLHKRVSNSVTESHFKDLFPVITPDANHFFRILEGKKKCQIRIKRLGTSLVVQWFQSGVGLIPGFGS